MAQTIALQRGSTTVSSGGGSGVTLFTQSGGTATRVIINGLAFKNSVAGSGCVAQLYVAQSGGSVFWAVAAKGASSGNACGGFDFFPGTFNMNGAQRESSSSSLTGAVILGINTNNVFPADGNVAAYNIFSTNNVTSNVASMSNYETCPQQFWIGSGDAVAMKIFNNGGGTATIGFSFTTITES